MRDYKIETEKRVAFIRSVMSAARADGIVYGNSGGKDSALVGILCKKACDNTVGILLPCQSKRNYEIDRNDGIEVAEKFGIETRMIDVTPVKEAMEKALDGVTKLTMLGSTNVNPRLRMTALYAVAASENRLVAGTGNASERYLGYFTKWGDGACDFNPIGDLTVTEIFEFLRYLGCPDCILTKAPSAGLFDGQTDEEDMGIRYADVDRFLATGEAEPEVLKKLESRHRATEHKRTNPPVYSDKE